MFFQSKNNKLSEVVLNTSVLDANNSFSSNTERAIRAAQYLRQEILEYSDKLDPLNWPRHQMN